MNGNVVRIIKSSAVIDSGRRRRRRAIMGTCHTTTATQNKYQTKYEKCEGEGERWREEGEGEGHTDTHAGTMLLPFARDGGHHIGSTAGAIAHVGGGGGRGGGEGGGGRD